MYVSTFTLILVLLGIWLYEWLTKISTPEHHAWLRQRQVWKQEDLLKRQQNRAACRDLQRRFRVAARRYARVSLVTYGQFVHRARHCRTDAALNRYVTLAERYWETKEGVPPARSSVAVPTLPGH